MAHFGVQKAKSKALTALVAAAAIGGSAFLCSPANAAAGDINDFGDFTIEMDGTMPKMLPGSGSDYNAVFDMDYNPVDQGFLDNNVYYTFKLKDNNYFACSREDTSLNILLKNQAGFKAFTTNEDYAENMTRICELTTSTHYAGKIGDDVANVTSGGPAHANYIHAEEGRGLTLKTDVPYKDYGISVETSDGGGFRVMSQDNDGGKLSLVLGNITPGFARLTVTNSDDSTEFYTFEFRIADTTYQDSQGNVYFYQDEIFRGTDNRVDVRYIGSENLSLANETISVAPGSDFSLGAGERNVLAVSDDPTNPTPIPVNIDANLGTLASQLDIEGEGSKVNLTVGLAADVQIKSGNELTITSESSQKTSERVAVVGIDGAKTTFEGGNFDDIRIVSGWDSELTINDGTYGQKTQAGVANTDALIIVNAGSTATINGGNFTKDVTELPNDTEGIWHNDTFALIHGYGADITINDGTFQSNGSIISSEKARSENPEIIVNGGSFKAKHAMAISNDWDGVTSIKGGTFDTDDRFYVWDVMNDWACNKVPFEDTGLGDVSRACSDDGEELNRRWGTSVQGYTRVLVDPTKENTVVTGGLFTDGFNPEDGSGVEPADGYGQVPAPGHDGYVIVLPQTVHDGITVNFPETKQLDLDSENANQYDVVSIDNSESCFAEMRDGKLYVTAKSKATEAGQYCKVTVSDGRTGIEVFNVEVTNNTTFVTGEPIGLPVGETVTPSDFTDGKTIDDYEEWMVLEGEGYCTVSENGEITAVKGGGICAIGAYDEDSNEVRVWIVTTTEPMELEIGESKKPTDLPQGIDPTSGEWSSDNTDVCTVAEDGTITAKKAGTCHVSLKIGSNVYTWLVNIKDNPNTLDKKAVISFTTAGALIGALGAVIATIKRFGRR